MTDYWVKIRNDNRELGALIHMARRAAMLSQPELIEHLDLIPALLDVPTLSRIEHGSVVPIAPVAKRLTEWLASQHVDATLSHLAQPVARAHDPQTSHDAARSVTPTTLRHLHTWWLRHLDRMWAKDPDQLNLNGDPIGYFMTDEGARKFYDGPKVSDSGFRTRRAELRQAGLVTDSGRRYPISTGRMANAWQLTPTGRTALKETPHHDID